MAFTTRCRAALALLAASALLALAAPPAVAADPGRWREVKRSPLPLNYYQGVAADSQQRLYFDGVYSGLYRTSASLAEQARTDDVIPPAVRVAEGYNHIGDIAWDAREGGRLLLPLECYFPGGPGDGNTCKTGSIAVADPESLRWRYYVKLDQAEIAKAMWNEVSPDGALLWSQAGEDLLAYDMNQIARSNQAPAGPKLRAVRRLKGAVPPGGITGAAFYGGRLYAAGTREDTLMQVWSIDLAEGSRRLEIEREVVGESEGLMVADVLSGVLHWMITPFNTIGRPPTYGPSNVQLLSFLPAEAGQLGQGGGRKPLVKPVLRMSLSRATVRKGRRARIRFRVVRDSLAGRSPAAGARILFAGRRLVADRRGRASVVLRFAKPGKRRAVARLRGARSAVATVRVGR